MGSISRSLAHLFLATLISISASSGFAQFNDRDYEIPVSSEELKVASYNVENLFDTLDDRNKADETFLPKGFPTKNAACAKMEDGFYKEQCFNTDWTEKRLMVKLLQVQRALQAQGSMPDALVLSEIENQNVVGMLAQLLGYEKNFVASNGPDSRGIDVAILWNKAKLAYVEHREMPVGNINTRPVLKVMFQVRAARSRAVGANLVIYANHWPSQAGPSNLRVAAAETLAASIEADSKSVQNYHAIAMGDFNVVPKEKPSPLDIVLNPRWNNSLRDAHAISDKSKNPMNGRMPDGSYFYKGQWQRLDHIMVSQNLVDGGGFELIPESFRVVAPLFLTKAEGGRRIPWRYNFDALDPAQAGFSDHLALAVKLHLP